MFCPLPAAFMALSAGHLYRGTVVSGSPSHCDRLAHCVLAGTCVIANTVSFRFQTLTQDAECCGCRVVPVRVQGHSFAVFALRPPRWFRGNILAPGVSQSWLAFAMATRSVSCFLVVTSLARGSLCNYRTRNVFWILRGSVVGFHLPLTLHRLLFSALFVRLSGLDVARWSGPSSSAIARPLMSPLIRCFVPISPVLCPCSSPGTQLHCVRTSSPPLSHGNKLSTHPDRGLVSRRPRDQCLVAVFNSVGSGRLNCLLLRQMPPGVVGQLHGAVASACPQGLPP